MYPSSLPNIDLQVLPTFPAHVGVTGVLTLVKSGLSYTFGVNFQNVIEETNVSDMSKREVLVQDTDTGAFWRVKLTNLPTGQTDWANIQNKPTEFPPSPHTHPVSQISDATPLGQSLVTAADAAAARAAIGAVNRAGDAMTGALRVHTTLFVDAANASESPAVRLMDETGVRRGTVYWDRALNQVWVVLHDATGAAANSIRLSATGAFVGSSLIWTNGNKQIADGQVLGNVSGSTGVPVGVTLSALLDKISNTRGAVLHRGASGWAALGAGTAGQVLTSGGAGADPSWQTPSGPDALSFSVLAMQVADLANQALFLGDSGNRIFDSFGTLDYVDVAGATNLDTSTPGELKPTTSNPRVTGATPTGLATPAANFNDNNSGTTASWSGTDLTGQGDINNRLLARLDLGSVRTVTKIEVINAVQSVGGAADNFSLHYSVDGSNWTQLGAVQAGSTTPTSFDRTGGVSARYVAMAVKQTNWAGVTVTLAGLNAYAVTANNMTVASTAFTAASAPTAGKITARIIAVDPVTLNTDLMMDVSRDGGTTWTQVTLAEKFTQPGSIKVIESGEVDISSQPSGMAPKWRIRTANNKLVEVHDIALYWK